MKTAIETKVIFRSFKSDDSVIAIFPEIPGTNDPNTAMSYMTVGQHGSASISLLNDESTYPTRPAQYRQLYEELQNIGYNLRVMKRIHSNDRAKRIKEIENNG